MLAGLVAAVSIVAAATALGVLLFFGGDFTAPPTPGWLGANLTYTTLAGVVGGWVAHRLAPRYPLVHAAAVALLIVGMSQGGGQAEAGSGVPAWYGATVTVLGALGAAGGGILRSWSTRRRARTG